MAVDTKSARTGDGPPKANIAVWNDPFWRGIFFQALLVAFLVWFGWFLFSNTTANLERQNIASGFDFLSAEAGFNIIQTPIEYSEASNYGRVFLIGLINTIIVAVIGCFFATIFGFIMGVARLSSNWLISKLASVYIEVFRNIPLLLQIFFWYFAVLRSLPSVRESITMMGDSVFLNNRGLYIPRVVPEELFIAIPVALIIGIVASVLVFNWAKKRQAATGQQFPVFLTSLGLIVGLPLVIALVTGLPFTLEYPEKSRFNLTGGTTVIPELMALVAALSIYTASFIAEIVRSGIQSVSHGQSEAAHALGLRNGPTLRLIIIPQAMRVIIPPLTSQYLNLTKNSSLAAAIAYPDLVSIFAGTTLNQTGQAVEVLAMVLAVYLSLSLIISTAMNWYNQKMALVER
jgi:general L-amino acid transport system permease protein